MKAETRIRIRLAKKLIPGYALFFAFLALIGIGYGFVAGSAIGISFLFFSFVSMRNLYNGGITYHDDKTKRCIVYSMTLFAIAALPLIVFNMRISLLFSIPIAIGMTWLLHEFGLKKKAEIELKELKKPKKFNLDDCTEKELVERCRERFKRDVEYKTERAIKHFILKLPHEDIDVNPEQSKKERYRFRKILE